MGLRRYLQVRKAIREAEIESLLTDDVSGGFNDLYRR